MDIRDQYNRIARWYDVVELPMELLLFARWRKSIFNMIKENKFLEIGVGTGKNLRYYPRNTDATAIDLSERMLSYAQKRAIRVGAHVSLRNMNIQNLQFGAHLFPTIIGTFVLCSVPDPVEGLKQVKRILTPNGRLVLLEHVRPQNPLLGRLFDWLNPLVVKATGVNINRDTAENIKQAGFDIELEKNVLGNIFKFFVVRSK